ncbi:nodulation protein NfeD [Microbispora rosea]|uniref:NfeD family protein n=1 Tax=Microbispora rosea TaxID=58117 RepID=UPI003447467A
MPQRSAWLVIAWLFGVLFLLASAPAPHVLRTEHQGKPVLVARLDGTVTPVMADHLGEALHTAERGAYSALLVEMDTPGGLDSSMRKIVQSFLGARVPVIVYVTPPGGRAASAGTLITFSAHVAAMAPGTTIGAATPVDLQGGEISDKILNDAAAYAKSVAAQRGRDTAFAEDAVRKGRAVTADEAVRIGAVDLVAPDRGELLRAVDGRTVKAAGTTVTLRTAGARIDEHEAGPFRRLLQTLADPNIAFLFLSIGSLAIIYELASPGAGLAGVIGAVMLILGFFALSVLPVNVAGLGLLALALALFVAEVFTPGVGVFAGGGAIALLLSGLFLFQGPARVNPAVLWPTVLVIAAGVALAGRLAWRARGRPPVSGQEALIGEEAVVHDVHADRGRIFMEGCWWTAHTRSGRLADGEHVRVIAVEGVTLVVEPALGRPIPDRKEKTP